MMRDPLYLGTRMHPYLAYSPEVAHALQQQRPVLALESTVITHGLPYPQNLETAQTLEAIARDAGVTPATIAVMDEKIKIGLSASELTRLAQDTLAMKASKRDLAYALSQGINAGTTVAATLFCAGLCGIDVFATGGIGGVHRGEDMDISADLIELARTPIAVICAGAKAILDLPRTLEYLETMSVPVVGYRTDTLPAFYSASTDYPLNARADNCEVLATLFSIHRALGNTTGILVVNPIPSAFSIPAAEINPVIDLAVKKAAMLNIRGKAITPFLLSEVSGVTQGKSQQANIALIKNNVSVGAELAKALHAQNIKPFPARCSQA